MPIVGEVEIARHREQVAGVVGSSADRHRSWVRLWEEETGRIARTCVAGGCGEPAEVGGHVWIRAERSERFCYIVPLCFHHNGSSYDRGVRWFYTKPNTAFLKIISHECYFDNRDSSDSDSDSSDSDSSDSASDSY